MKTKVVVNKDSGNCTRLDIGALLKKLGCLAEVEVIDCKSEWNADGFDTLIVCGGDGTLHNAIEKCRGKRLVYVPCGTLNEAALTEQSICTLGNVNGMPFSYVCATGSFTEIGYSAKNSHKKRWKSVAYLPQMFRCYRCHEIGAKLDIDGIKYQGHYTLLMVLKSHRCFGFSFNNDYKKTKKSYLLAIKSFGPDSLKNRAKMFFPFFRIFFCGARPQTAQNWLLLPFDNLTIELDKPQDFCFDGEKRRMEGRLHFSQQTLDEPIEVVSAPMCRRGKRAFDVNKNVEILM